MVEYTNFIKAIITAGIVAFIILGLSRTKWMRMAGQVTISVLFNWRPFSPNWITVYSTVITLTAFFAFYPEHPLIAIGLGTFGALLDRMDGKMAHALGNVLSAPSDWRVDDDETLHYSVRTKSGECEGIALGKNNFVTRLFLEMNFGGQTDLGKIFDPMADKIKCLAILLVFAMNGSISPWLLFLLFIPELIGTLIRRPFYFLSSLTKEARATSVGKYKNLFQWLTVLCALIFHLRWIGDTAVISEWNWLPNAMLSATIVLAIISVASRLTIVRQNSLINDTINVLDRTVEHD